MTDRPVYVGVGTCECKRMDVRLFNVPNTPFVSALLCGHCLERNGFEIPKSRTAADIETVDGELRWKKP